MKKKTIEKGGAGISKNGPFLFLFFRSLCDIFVLVLFILTACQKDTKYGLITKDERYNGGYYLTNAELLIKDMKDFEKQLETEGFKKLQRKADKAEKYMQAEVIFEPIIQRVNIGEKNVFVFEKAELGDVWFKRLAFECKNFSDLMEFPDNCTGCLIEVGGDWPPNFHQIIKGSIHLKQQSLTSGILSGDMNLFFSKGKELHGDFHVFDKNKHFFLEKPIEHL